MIPPALSMVVPIEVVPPIAGMTAEVGVLLSVRGVTVNVAVRVGVTVGVMVGVALWAALRPPKAITPVRLTRRTRTQNFIGSSLPVPLHGPSALGHLFAT